MSKLERDIQAEIMLALGRKYRLWRSNSGKWRVVDKPCARCAQRARWIEGAPTGCADLVGIGPNGRFLGVEVKRPGETQSDEQINFEAMVRTHGGIYVVAHSRDEALDKIEREA